MDRTPTEPTCSDTDHLNRQRCLESLHISESDGFDNGYYEPVYGIKYATSTDGVY